MNVAGDETYKIKDGSATTERYHTRFPRSERRGNQARGGVGEEAVEGVDDGEGLGDGDIGLLAAGELDHEGWDAGVGVEGAVGGGVVVGGGEVDGVVGYGEAVVEALEVQGDADAGAAAGEGRVVEVEGCCADGHSPVNGRRAGGRVCEMWRRMETNARVDSLAPPSRVG